MLSRRRFTELLTLSSSVAFLARDAHGLETTAYSTDPLPKTPARPDERFWQQVRSRYLVPDDVAFLNAANLCPMPLPVLEALDRQNRRYEVGPSPDVRAHLMSEGREAARTLLATMLGVAPETIVITRNTSEGNNMVSSGVPLGPDDEVIVFSDNHPSNLLAWTEKARRFGFRVKTLAHVVPHPGAEYYVDLFRQAITPRTRLIGFTHLTSNSGDLFPAAEICAMARARGVLTLLDAAQTFGGLDIDLSRIQPDFFTGSAHKWPCGPKECGVLYVRPDAQDRIWPSVVGVYAGAVGVSRKLEGMGQRDDVRLVALAEALRFREAIGRSVIEARIRELAQALMEGLSGLPGVALYTHRSPDRSASLVVVRPGALDPRKLGAALMEKERIVCTVRGGQDRPGLRFSPHLYNTMADVDRTVATVRRYLSTGV
ncbi:MAG: aminotransferase class V-fold PLP-dependent enzyme [Gemmatimonadaceae bacterium]|nr:aminotransferase class V-fold PLP-dependent enzyme [Gemmatimonadaceae bacterium]